MSYLGLDVGTTGCKAVVFDENGRQLASAYREYPVLSPNEGWAEIDSRLVSESCMDVIREAAASCSDDPVRGMGISSQGEAFTPVGPGGEMLGNGMVSSDARATAISENWSREFGRERLYEITGHTAHPMFTLFKLLWVRDNLPDAWNRAEKFYCFEELIHLKLGLDPAISWPLAGRTMMYDVRKHEWSPEILGAVGVHPTKLARTLPAGAVVGTIPPDVAQSLGLRDGVIVVAGGHDQTCGALGAGVASKGRAVYATGTVECITPAFQEPIFSSELYEKNLCTYDFTVKGMYTTVAFSLTGGNLLKWFRDEWSREEVAEAERTGANAYELIMKSMPDEPSKLLVLPYFTPTGTPYFDTEVKGAILGLRLSTTRGEVLRALLEGVAFEMRLNMDILDRSGIHIDELVAIGGGAKNRRWTQLKADVMGKPISTAEVTEAGCLGVAMLARAADTGENLTDLARRWVRLTEVVDPNPSNAAYYRDRFQAYLELYPVLRRLTQELVAES
jgi:xylulokinase